MTSETVLYSHVPRTYLCVSLCFYLTRQLCQRLFHPPKFREAFLEVSGCPQLTSHLNSSVFSLWRLQKGNQNPTSRFHQQYVPPDEPQGLGCISIIQCLK